MGLKLPRSDESKSAAVEPVAFDVQTENPLVDLLHDAIVARIQSNRTKHSDTNRLTIFHALKAPSISLREYIVRLLRYTCCSQPCFISALMCLDRAAEMDPSLRLDSLNVHRLLITSVMIAAKFWDDTYFVSSYYARVGGVPTAELNALELEFLLRMNFRVSFAADDVAAFERRLALGPEEPRGNCAKLAIGVKCTDQARPRTETPVTGDAEVPIYPRRW